MTTTTFPTGPFTIREAAAAGITHRQVERACDSGGLVRICRGVYAPADLPDTYANRIAGLARAISAHHVATDRTAGWLHGIDAMTLSEHDVWPPIETSALRGRNPTRRPEARGGTRDLAARDITVVGGIRVTTPLRTALDLGCNLRRREALAAMVGLARRHGLTAEDLRRELPRFRRRRGVVQLRQLCPLVDPRIESEREAWTWLAIHDAGLPLPVPQLWVEIDGVPVYRLDFAYPNARTCVEYDGIDAHERTAEQKEYDERRRRWLRENGWTVIVVRRGDFTGEALQRWLSELREALRPSYTNRRW